VFSCALLSRTNRIAYDTHIKQLQSTESSQVAPMTNDILIAGGNLFLGGEFVQGNLLIDEGKITAITSSDSISSSRRIDATGKLVIPGWIDTHTHVGEPGARNEDFRSGTMAAAAGGVTTIFEMPSSIPPTTNVDVLEARMRLASEKAIVDYAFLGGASSSNLDEIPKLAKRGVIAFKTFMFSGHSEGFTDHDNYGLMRTMLAVKETGLPHVLHAEDDSLIQGLSTELQRKNRSDVASYCESRPPYSEALGVIRAAYLAKKTNARIVIAHVSSAEALNAIEQARRNGVDIVAEGRPDFFIFTREDLGRIGPFLKTIPPLREESDVETMWSALNEGRIEFIGSDHAPRTRAEKAIGWHDIWATPAGTPILEVMMPLMLDKMARVGTCSLERLVVAATERPAKYFGIFPKKGTLRVGSDADIVIVDPKLEKKIKTDEFYSKGKESAAQYEGMLIKGWPITTILRGEVVMQDGVVDQQQRGRAKFVTPITHFAS